MALNNELTHGICDCNPEEVFSRCFTPFSPERNDSEWGRRSDMIGILVVFHPAEELQAQLNLAGAH